MPFILKIAQIGAPILRQKALEVEFPLNETYKLLYESLLLTLSELGSIGLAAPQINAQSKIIVISSRPNKVYPNEPILEPIIMFNPKLIKASDLFDKYWETCFSIPGIRGSVKRSKEIELEYYDIEGNKQYLVLTNMAARVFQHEYDHLDGILYLDRLESNIDIISEEEYQKMIRKI